jgi:hypothetical protein
MSVAHTAGRFVGQAAAYAYEGTKLASTQFAAGAQEGYAERAASLRAQRMAAIGSLPPAVVAQAKARVVKVKA